MVHAFCGILVAPRRSTTWANDLLTTGFQLRPRPRARWNRRSLNLQAKGVTNASLDARMTSTLAPPMSAMRFATSAADVEGGAAQ
eukprot:2457436-Pyramimonas_sp.AAC.1